MLSHHRVELRVHAANRWPTLVLPFDMSLGHTKQPAFNPVDLIGVALKDERCPGIIVQILRHEGGQHGWHGFGGFRSAKSKRPVDLGQKASRMSNSACAAARTASSKRAVLFRIEISQSPAYDPSHAQVHRLPHPVSANSPGAAPPRPQFVFCTLGGHRDRVFQ